MEPPFDQSYINRALSEDPIDDHIYEYTFDGKDYIIRGPVLELALLRLEWYEASIVARNIHFCRSRRIPLFDYYYQIASGLALTGNITPRILEFEDLKHGVVNA